MRKFKDDKVDRRNTSYRFRNGMGDLAFQFDTPGKKSTTAEKFICRYDQGAFSSLSINGEELSVVWVVPSIGRWSWTVTGN